ncbi:MAG: aldolase/citrate lyase family protein [Armatimonadota bacterium]|nr:aldolase/citrate lyase family protein [Armatimonadota bacterium]MDR7401221.1 aldolase/citrate lyase family protein [Armatimonadota bacterium]MDR7403020.1 aldolase/citrate lyase family protein [Armatimonadota bacterium]MDR7437721.1 aldolase/citrate lyase family protein [Armatimonadota bacterium]MDR7471874.1 aldolase/citrate lyase family protein [Armatimonadota bacterium]
MLVNKVKQLLADGRPAIGQWVSLPSPQVAEILALAGMDWLVIDAEHGPADWETVEDIVRALDGTGVTPLVRVPANDPALIKRALDRGALGVVVPLVHTASQAQAAVAAARFPPEGIRGVAGTRASRYGRDLPQYLAEWNRQVLVACQVETPEAVRQAEAIAAVPGVDVLFVGPSDLSANLGCFRQFDHPEFVAALERILAAARAHGKVAGIMAGGAEDALARIDQGFRFVSVGSDTRMLASAAASAHDRVRAGLAERGW